jgi:hypothetical protein
MTARVGQTLSAWVLATALAGLLTACGDDSSTAADPASSPSSAASASSEPSSTATAPASESPSTPPPSGPACGKVWQEGATLTRSYQGCVEGGTYVDRDVLGCSSGQRIVRFDEHFYAALGGRIYQTESVLDKDRGYRDAVAVCRG